MSVVAISETVGSLGLEIGRLVAERLGYECADREIIAKAAERFGGVISELTHAVEERPRLWEHFTETQRRYVTYVEATILEMAARDNVVLVGRAATVVLGDAPHTLRVRITAPAPVRVRRVQEQLGPAATEYVRHTDRERGARVRFLYHVDWEEPLLYDLVLNTAGTDGELGARLVREALEDPRFRATEASRRVMLDLSLVAQAQAVLLADPVTRSRQISVSCSEGVLTLAGSVDAAQVWEAAENVVAPLPGLAAVRNDIVVLGQGSASRREPEEMSHHQYLHGEAMSWGGHGGDWYEREWQALRKYRSARAQRERR